MTTNHLVNHIPSDNAGTPGDGTVTDITVSSPNATLDITNGEITTSGTIEIDINGQPPADNTKILGARLTRWGGLIMALDSPIDFHSGATGADNTNKFYWVDGTGPRWLDRTANVPFSWDLTALTVGRTATWQDSSGTVAWLSNTGFDDPGIAIPGTGDTVTVAGPQLLALTGIRPAGTLSALTLEFIDGVSNAVARIMCTHIITTVTVTGNINLDASRKILDNPTTLVAGQILEYWWDESGSSNCWVRVQ